MAGQGTTTIDFGAFPGATDATVVITGQAAITTSNLVEAWINPTATADHTADEHWVDPPEVFAGNIVNGTGFTIYGVNKKRTDVATISDSQRFKITDYPRIYGLWTVNWVWA
jgi:hypothetical protein